MRKQVIAACILLILTSCNDSGSSSSDISPLMLSAAQASDMPEKYTHKEMEEMLLDFDEVIESFKSPISCASVIMANRQVSLISSAWYKCYGQLAAEKIDSTDQVFISRQQEAVNTLQKYQRVMFPKYRKVFVDYAVQMLWEHDCEAEVSGPNNTLLTLTGNFFLPNKNKKAAYEELNQALKNYRFKKLAFKCYADDDKITRFEIYSDGDEDYVGLN